MPTAAVTVLLVLLHTVTETGAVGTRTALRLLPGGVHCGLFRVVLLLRMIVLSLGVSLVGAVGEWARAGQAGLAGRVSGVVLLNCAGGLNNKAITDDWRIKLALPVFYFIDFLLSIPPVARAIFKTVKTR